MLKVRINTERLISTHLVDYASLLIITTKEPKTPFYTSPEIIDSELLMWDTKFTTKNLTYYKNSGASSREVLYETHSCQIYKSNASISLVTLNHQSNDDRKCQTYLTELNLNKLGEIILIYKNCRGSIKMFFCFYVYKIAKNK